MGGVRSYPLALRLCGVRRDCGGGFSSGDDSPQGKPRVLGVRCGRISSLAGYRGRLALGFGARANAKKGMSRFYYKFSTHVFDAAGVAAGTAFVVVPFDLSAAPETWIDSIEYVLGADVVDQPAIYNLNLSLFRNVVVVQGTPLAVQVNPATGASTLWQANSQRPGDYSLSRAFGSPLILDSQFRYSMVGVLSLTAVLNTFVRLNLSIAGRIKLPEAKDEFFGRVR